MDLKTQGEIQRLRHRIKKAQARLKAGKNVLRNEKRRGQVTEGQILDNLAKRLAYLLGKEGDAKET